MPLEMPGMSSSCGRERRAESDVPRLCQGGSPSRTEKQRRDKQSSHRDPRFWDTLSKIRLSQGALKEFDRRRVVDTQPDHHGQSGSCSAAFDYRDIKQFARRGGPSLAHLRGYANLTIMSQSSVGGGRTIAQSDGLASDRAFRSTPYTPNCEQKLIDCGVFPISYGEQDGGPTNEEEILARMRAPRASLSSSRFTDQDFKIFRRNTNRTWADASMMEKVFSVIEGGGGGHKYRTAANLAFTCMKSMADHLAQAKPDLYDGTALELIDLRVRTELRQLIIPSNISRTPAAPNFFIEGKSVGGRADIACLQACHDGAIGARGIHALRSYGENPPVYDSRAYSFSTIYHDGCLTLYAHYCTGSTKEGRDAEYHMKQLRAYAVTSDRTSFQIGASAHTAIYANMQKSSGILR